MIPGDIQTVFDQVWAKMLEHLMDYMNEHDYSARQVADKLGITHSTVSRWLRGERGQRVSLLDFMRLLRVLHLSTGDVLAMLTNEDAAQVIAWVLTHDQTAQKLMRIITRGGEDEKHLRQEIDYIYSKGNYEKL